MGEELTAQFIGIMRHRITTDGEGITTLVAFHGCPLKCQYCLNPQCNKKETPTLERTPFSLLKEVSIDNLYFQATGGGVTFGGGEPLLQSRFIAEFHKLCPAEWTINIETSLSVSLDHLKEVSSFVHQFYIDIKDINPDIYLKYTGQNNQQVLNNLTWICEQNLQDICVIRLPLIPDYNTQEDQDKSQNYLQELGFEHFNRFKYITHINKGT
ncbi:MAG: radical SAM protein [Paludibacteraceae bacterium]|nr:radical SAM protein [Paludibacteraceae bacterium]